MTAMFIWRDESGAPCTVIKNALDHNGCDNLIKQLKGETTPGTHIEDDGSVTTGHNEQRNSDVSWFNDIDLHNTIKSYVDVANYECGWRYDIVDSEMLQFTVYDGEKKQHYDWHTDGQCDHNCARKSATFHNPDHLNLMYTNQTNLLGTVRKLSVSAILNDGYEGGDMLFRFLNDRSNLAEVAIQPAKGDIVIFPSYIDHKVAPVTKGIRYSVVAWFGGPPFK